MFSHEVTECQFLYIIWLIVLPKMDDSGLYPIVTDLLFRLTGVFISNFPMDDIQNNESTLYRSILYIHFIFLLINQDIS